MRGAAAAVRAPKPAIGNVEHGVEGAFVALFLTKARAPASGRHAVRLCGRMCDNRDRLTPRVAKWKSLAGSVVDIFLTQTFRAARDRANACAKGGERVAGGCDEGSRSTSRRQLSTERL